MTFARLTEAADNIIRRFHVSMTPAHSIAAQACLGMLLHLDEDVVTEDSLGEWPLAEYATGHWADHARFEDVPRNVEDGIKQLFEPSKPHLLVAFLIHDPWNPRNLPKRRRLAGRRPLPRPLHDAAI